MARREFVVGALLWTALWPSSGWAQGVIAPVKMKLAAPSAVGQPIGIPAKLSVKIVPSQQPVIIGAPVTLTVQVSAVAVSVPIVLSAQTSSGRAITLSPPQLPAGSGGTVTMTLSPAENEQPGTQTVQVQATAGGISATSPPSTLNFADPDCGSGPPVLSFSVPSASWSFQVSTQPAPAAVKLRVINTGGRLPSPITMRVFRVGSNCQAGSCINGPLVPNGAVSTLEVSLRGGCARTLYEASIPATSSIRPISCRPGSTFKLGVNAQVQLVGAPELQGGPNLVLDCGSVLR